MYSNLSGNIFHANYRMGLLETLYIKVISSEVKNLSDSVGTVNVQEFELVLSGKIHIRKYS